MINVAYILTPIEFGGAERVSLNFLKAFDREKFNIIPILFIRPWEDYNFFVKELEKLELKYLLIPVAIRPMEMGKDYFRILRCYYLLFSILNKYKFSVMHTNGYLSNIIGIPLARLCRIPHVVTCHGFIDNDIKLKIYNLLDIFFLRFSNRIISVSGEIKEKLIRHGVPEKKVSTFQNSVSLPDYSVDKMLSIRELTRKRFNILESDYLIGYTGRLSEEKGLKFLIESTRQLLDMGVPIKVLLVGDGPQRPFLETMAKDLGVHNHILFAGFQKDVTKFLSAFDIFVLPSLTEGTPMSLLEAMSFGVPVIATKVGGIPKVITHGKTGILISPSNTSEIVSSVYKLYNDENYRTSLSHSAKALIRDRYNLDVHVKKVEDLYFELLQQFCLARGRFGK